MVLYLNQCPSSFVNRLLKLFWSPKFGPFSLKYESRKTFRFKSLGPYNWTPWNVHFYPMPNDRSHWTWVWSSHLALNIPVALSSRNLNFKLECYILDKRMRLNWFWLILFRDPGRTQHLSDRNTANAADIFFQFSIRFFFQFESKSDLEN